MGLKSPKACATITPIEQMFCVATKKRKLYSNSINVRKDDIMDNNTTKYVIDFKNVKGHFDMFEIISTAMDFPDYFGNNWDAFWDCMTDLICINLEIEILNLDALDSDLREDKEKLICLLKELKHLDNDEWCNITIIKIQDGENEYYIE